MTYYDDKSHIQTQKNRSLIAVQFVFFRVVGLSALGIQSLQSFLQFFVALQSISSLNLI